MVIKKFIPSPFRKLWRFLIRRKRDAVFSQLSIQTAFQKIYDDKLWGDDMSGTDYYSGQGSHSEQIIIPYIQAISNFISTRSDILTASDLGCGDFNVGARLFQLFESYHAIDLVSSLIERNQVMFRGQGLRFMCADITQDKLPSSDIAFVRQALQHLSNRDI